MHKQIEKLIVIQERDLKIINKSNSLKKLPLRVKLIKENLAEYKNKLDNEKNTCSEIEKTINKLELDINTNKEKILKLKDQQNKIKKNIEYQAMTKEIEGYKNEITELEDTEIENMTKLEQANETLEQAQKEFEREKEFAIKKIDDLKIWRENIEKEIKELSSKKDNFKDEIDSELLKNYDDLIKRNQNKVVVELKDGVCDGCKMTGQVSTINDLKQNNGFGYCSSCSRILYLDI